MTLRDRNKTIFQVLFGICLLLSFIAIGQAQQQQPTPTPTPYEGGKGVDSGGYDTPDKKTADKPKPPSAKKKSVPASAILSKRKKAAATAHKYEAPEDFPETQAPKGKEYVDVGVTYWKMRPCPCGEKCSTDNPKSLLDEDGVRVSDEILLSEGDRIQVGIEPMSSAGYLYIINHEVMPDGSWRTPLLLFPTTKRYDGNNYIYPGIPLVLPSPVNGFKVCPTKGEPKFAEAITIVFSPVKLDGIEWTADLLQKWEREGMKYRADLQDGLKLKRTQHEAIVQGAKSLLDEDDALTQEDPPPQINFRIENTIKKPAVVTIYLRYKNAQ